jgi:hypothetical protein
MKKLMVVMVLCMMVLGLGSVDVKASTDVDELVVVTNLKLEDMILDAQEDADKVLANDSLTEDEKDAKIDAIIEKLIEKTNKVAAKTIVKADKNDVLVICEYVEVLIGDVIVLVDPLRVGEFIDVQG